MYQTSFYWNKETSNDFLIVEQTFLSPQASLLVITWYIRVAERLKTEDLRKLGNIRRTSKLHRIIA